MKPLIPAIGLVVLFAAQACAISGGNGGVIYWNGIVPVGSPVLPKQKTILYRMTVDGMWNAGPVNNFDNIPWLTSTAGFSNANEYYRGVEVLDPRSLGGTGKLLVSALYNNTPPSGGFTVPPSTATQQPFDILKVDPNVHFATYNLANGNLLSDGSMWGSTWSSQDAIRVLAAPQNLGGKTTNGLALLHSGGGSYSGSMYYLFDANNNHTIDNGTGAGAEGTFNFQPYQRSYRDLEFGNDKALYASFNVATGITAEPLLPGEPANTAKITRAYLTGTGAGVLQTYFFQDCTTSVLGASANANPSLATGPGTANRPAPIVYMTWADNNVAGGPFSAIFALQDGDGDNAVSFSELGSGRGQGTEDIIKEIWHSGQNGITQTNGQGANIYQGIQDIELAIDPDNGAKTLIFAGLTSSGAGLYALSLSDNGLEVVGTGKTLKLSSTSGGPGMDGGARNSYIAGFELDMNPPSVVPEPVTLLLIGTGALGVLGHIRRQRMK